MTKFYISLLLFSVLAQKSNAQTLQTSTLKWNAVSAVDIRTGSPLAYTSAFITHGTEYIEWLQKSETVVQRFDITESKGTWNDVAQPGKITFTVSMNESTGQVVFERTSTGVFVTVDFGKNNPYGIRQRFTIDDVNLITP